MVGEGEVEDEGAARGIAAQVGALRPIEEISPCAVRLVPIGGVAEGE
jgi:hypothetical protein